MRVYQGGLTFTSIGMYNASIWSGPVCAMSNMTTPILDKRPLEQT